MIECETRMQQRMQEQADLFYSQDKAREHNLDLYIEEVKQTEKEIRHRLESQLYELQDREQ